MATVTIRPNSDVFCDWILSPSGDACYPLIDEETVDTGDYIYISGPAVNKQALFGWTSTGLTDESINKITAYAHCTNIQSTLSLRSDFNFDTYSSTHRGTFSLDEGSLYSVELTQNSGSGWTVSSLEDTDFGLGLPSDAKQTQRVNQFYIVVDYTESAGGDDYTLTCAAGSYSLTGTNADLTVKRNYVLACSAGSYSLTGANATLTAQFNYSLICEASSYSLTGTNALFEVKRNYAFVCEAGSYSLTGSIVDLTVQRNYTLSLEVGTYSLTGTNAGLTSARTMALESGSYALTGTNAGFYRALVIACEAGSYALTGSDASLTSHRIFALGMGSYVLVGTSVGLFILSPTPACRTATIEYENRTFAIPHENRTEVIEAEDRTLSILACTDGG